MLDVTVREAPVVVQVSGVGDRDAGRRTLVRVGVAILAPGVVGAELVAAGKAPVHLEGDRLVLGVAAGLPDEDLGALGARDPRTALVATVPHGPPVLVVAAEDPVEVRVALEAGRLGVHGIDAGAPAAAELPLPAETGAQRLRVVELWVDVRDRGGDARRRVLVVDRRPERHVSVLARSHVDAAVVRRYAVGLDLVGEQQGGGAAEEEADAAAEGRIGPHPAQGRSRSAAPGSPCPESAGRPGADGRGHPGCPWTCSGGRS